MRKITSLILFTAICMGFLSCGKSIRTMLEPGVTAELARYRKKQISQVAYDLHFRIPESKDSAVTGRATIRFHQARAMYGVILDFQAGEDHVHQVVVNGVEDDYQVLNGHIIIPSKHIIPGPNTVEIAFTATRQALNRADGFMYSLFVPDRASTAFPCFDQPDLKATFSLSLDIPAAWEAVSNGPLQNTSVHDDRKSMVFAPDQPISTYLFAFAAGRFDAITDSSHGRTMTIFHRETDSDKLERNTARIFRQHAEALAWLEEYTGIPYPFAKFDMVLIPGFQYSGMEHPGAIWYRDTRLLLDEQAPISQQLAKANLIAHETAHMWFGDLVTMDWFDDVWLKEVFAGFMADKIVNPQFPEVNHDLQFLLTHYPRALAIDRTRGTHPIKQELGNLKNAGTLYGAIIYNKAPIVFQDLERLMGASNFRKAVREYLAAYYLDNADWDNLAAIFDRHTAVDIIAWSKEWIYGTGMPPIYTEGMNEDYLRAAATIERHESFLHTDEDPGSYWKILLQNLREEENPQIVRYLTANIQSVYWRFLDHDRRMYFANDVEGLLWDRLLAAEAAEKPVFLEAFINTAISDDGISRLKALFSEKHDVKGLLVTEENRFGVVTSLMLLGLPEAEGWLDGLLHETSNPDRKRRIAFLMQVLSNDPGQRERFFMGLKDPANRRPEPWALEGLGILHHPLRNEPGGRYIREGLEMLGEIQRTGDIFFPLNWLNAILGGYSDPETAALVVAFLDGKPELDPNLRLKVWQAADLLIRAAEKKNQLPG